MVGPKVIRIEKLVCNGCDKLSSVPRDFSKKMHDYYCEHPDKPFNADEIFIKLRLKSADVETPEWCPNKDAPQQCHPIEEQTVPEKRVRSIFEYYPEEYSWQLTRR